MIEYIAFMGAVLGYPLAWYFGGKKKSSVDAVKSISSMYDDFSAHYKIRMDEMQIEISSIKEHSLSIQLQFNEMTLAYGREVEVSQNWEKLNVELKSKYDALLKDHLALQKDHNLLKKDYESFKKKKV
jgi:hypothetical protein